MKVGISVHCKICGQTKKPQGRSQPMGAYYCDSECSGYYENPLVGDLWPGEREEDFGYPVVVWGTKEVGSKAEGGRDE
jgi:hypothetical protein